MEELRPTPRTTLKRYPKRGSYDRAVLYRIIDEALICHIGFVEDGSPFVIPTLHVRIGDRLYIHGSAASRTLRRGAAGIPLCVTITHVDALVLARSAFHHSINYRSALIMGTAHEVFGDENKTEVLHALVEHIVSGRWKEVRPPMRQELAATKVLALPIDEASVKVRIGGPLDDEADYSLPVWAGVLPLSAGTGKPHPDARLPASTEVPSHLRNYLLPAARG